MRLHCTDVSVDPARNETNTDNSLMTKIAVRPILVRIAMWVLLKTWCRQQYNDQIGDHVDNATGTNATL